MSPGSRDEFRLGTKLMVNRTDGFTLVELLVAFAILAVSLSAIYRGFSVSLKSSDRTERIQTAVLIAQTQLARVGSEIPLGSDRIEGELDNNYYWRIDMALSEGFGSSRYFTPHEVTVSVSSERDGKPLVSLKTLLLKSAN